MADFCFAMPLRSLLEGLRELACLHQIALVLAWFGVQFLDLKVSGLGFRVLGFGFKV